jgi:predicted LPLAT superfamily acyltransferase
VQEYADLLEEVVRAYPLQWHNFYPFWDASGGAATATKPGHKGDDT